MHKSKRSILISFILFFTVISCNSQTTPITKVSVRSKSMKSEVNNIVILPADYDKKSKTGYPVVYLLHGYGDCESSFLDIKYNLPDLATQYQMIFVCPDGKKSWYLDSPISKTSQYETYLSKELVDYIDSHYKTISNRSGRAITGYSMGGYGAMWQAMTHPDVFGAVGSMSGAVDIRPFSNNWDIKEIIGEYDSNKLTWDKFSVLSNADKLANLSPAIIFDCGQGDFFLEVNENLHKKLISNGVRHTYISSVGTHNYEYWGNSLDWQLKFFSDYFLSAKPSM